MALLYCFFFFKQKTAYEMRISDWSSDVCSSDLTTGLELTLTDEVRAKIEAVIGESTDIFAKEVLDKLKDMRRQVKAAEDDELQRIFILSNISEIAFDITGMGGTFGR